MLDAARYGALSFDCYGTLIDWEAGITNWAADWQARGGQIKPRGFLQAFSGHERAVQAEQPSLRYPDVLAEVARRIAAAQGEPISDATAESFGASVGDWPAFPDSTEALRRLGERYKLIVLSNVDRTSFARSQERLAVRFDAIITAEDVGSYKPATANFDTLRATVDGIGVPVHALLHVGESLYHDIQPANRDGLDVVWINRAVERDSAPRASGGVSEDATPLATYPNMKAFADALLLA
ncbi:MAG: HAD-IA family hydrolase [Pseudomonadota bacterium]